MKQSLRRIEKENDELLLQIEELTKNLNKYQTNAVLAIENLHDSITRDLRILLSSSSFSSSQTTSSRKLSEEDHTKIIRAITKAVNGELQKVLEYKESKLTEQLEALKNQIVQRSNNHLKRGNEQLTQNNNQSTNGTVKRELTDINYDKNKENICEDYLKTIGQNNFPKQYILNGILSTGSCYIVSQWTETYYQARRACWSLNGELVSVENLKEQNFLQWNLLQRKRPKLKERKNRKSQHQIRRQQRYSRSIDWWTSGIRKADSWMWIYRQKYSSFPGPYSNGDEWSNWWNFHGRDSPETFDATGRCLCLSHKLNLYWRSESCLQKLRFICEIPLKNIQKKNEENNDYSLIPQTTTSEKQIFPLIYIPRKTSIATATQHVSLMNDNLMKRMSDENLNGNKKENENEYQNYKVKMVQYSSRSSIKSSQFNLIYLTIILLTFLVV
ncbi:hypothetical protein SNEBB_004495 [Seison nebaliae]|nr:hypothetical protein SNEBB_004495 [Seison nebaliae]